MQQDQLSHLFHQHRYHPPPRNCGLCLWDWVLVCERLGFRDVVRQSLNLLCPLLQSLGSARLVSHLNTVMHQLLCLPGLAQQSRLRNGRVTMAQHLTAIGG
jgi:hypothetical protein